MRGYGLAIYLLWFAALDGCTRFIPLPPEPSPGHLTNGTPRVNAEDIPSVVDRTPFLPPPQPQEEAEKYTVVVNEVSIKELLFALARDAKINVDISPRVQGEVTINAVEQTLPQILDRVSRQINIRYEIHDRTISVMPDDPYLQTYKVNYLNIQRDMKDTINVATQISTTGTSNVGGASGGSSGGGGLNNSTTTVTNVSNHHFWSNLAQNIRGIVGTSASGAMGSDQLSSDDLMVSPENGIVSVRATSKQHAQIRAYIDQVLESANRQVLIEATVVEVELKNNFQAGIDWTFLKGAGKFGGAIDLFAGVTAPPTTALSTLTYVNEHGVQATLNLLNKFGDTKVLSSPRLMVLNNQTAILKVVENIVYFSSDVKVGPANAISNTAAVAVTTRAETVPVGLVMSVTPQINENRTVMLNVRPSISDITDRVNDPNPNLVSSDPEGKRLLNQVPQIRVREMESMLRISSGQTAVLGGLIQDRVQKDTTKLPGIAELPVIGDVFFRGRNNDFKKTELVIFLRPVIIDNPSVDSAELQVYRNFLDRRTDVPPPR